MQAIQPKARKRRVPRKLVPSQLDMTHINFRRKEKLRKEFSSSKNQIENKTRHPEELNFIRTFHQQLSFKKRLRPEWLHLQL